jgi:hypothetical protein
MLRAQKKTRVSALCKRCERLFSPRLADVKRGDGKFCSLSCATKYNNNKRQKIGRHVCCFACGKHLYRKLTQIKRNKFFYCNRECKRIAETKGNQAGKRYGYQRKLALKQKASLIQIHGLHCQFPGCLWDTKNDTRLIDIHHFSGAFNHESTKLFCPGHHRLADYGYIQINVNGHIRRSSVGTDLSD